MKQPLPLAQFPLDMEDLGSALLAGWQAVPVSRLLLFCEVGEVHSCSYVDGWPELFVLTEGATTGEVHVQYNM